MKLAVLYDGRCGICRRCRDWLEAQDKEFELEFLSMQSPGVDDRFPGIRRLCLEQSLTAVDGHGRVYRGERAWIACLSSLRKYRGLTRGVSHPLLRPVVRITYAMVSNQRHRISRWLGLECEGNCHV